MSLRTRVILLVALVMAVSAVLGTLVMGYQVRREMAAELDAGMAGARSAAIGTFASLGRSDHPVRDLRQLVQTFDGNRHVRMTLIAAGDRVVAVSRSDVGAPPPGWFGRLVEDRPPAVVLPVPLDRAVPLALVLTPTPDPDVRAAWDEGVALAKVVVCVSVVGGILVWLAIGAGLRPLDHLGRQFERLGAGDYAASVVETGPPELRRLQRGFNDMTAQLATTMRRNRQLGEQLAQLQDEERAEIARDLHDEIGPRLFAVGMDAALIEQLCDAGRPADAVERARDIQLAVTYVQGQVRDLLGWLRPARLTEFGLAAAIEELTAFWTVRRSDILFDVAMPEGPIPEAVAETAYRIVQEALSNAVRHARPGRIDVTLRHEADDRLSIVVGNDGLSSGGAEPVRPGGFGLLGMRERVEALGGTLAYGPDGARWVVSAHIRSDANAPRTAADRDAPR